MRDSLADQVGASGAAHGVALKVAPYVGFRIDFQNRKGQLEDRECVEVILLDFKNACSVRFIADFDRDDGCRLI